MSAGTPTPDRDENDLVPIDIPPSAVVGSEDEPVFKRRRDFLDHEDFSLSPASLVGSFCHRVENGEIVWEGAVLGEPGPGAYLVELTSSLPGQGRLPVQVLATLDSMLAKDEGYEWRFYDSEEAMRSGYAEFVRTTEPERS